MTIYLIALRKLLYYDIKQRIIAIISIIFFVGYSEGRIFIFKLSELR